MAGLATALHLHSPTLMVAAEAGALPCLCMLLFLLFTLTEFDDLVHPVIKLSKLALQ